jgi:hypothetical protein
VPSASKDSPTPLESQWLVSVPHTALREVDGHSVERPYGVIHARESGSGLTACGQYAVGWRIFWELRFSTTDADSCPECIDAVAGMRSGNVGA